MTWYNTSYLHKKLITIDHTKVSGTSDLSSFPVLISRIDTDLKTVGNGGSVQSSSGFDIIFVDSTESTKLDHEIEKYVASTGEIEMWVRIPTLSHTADTLIYLYYDNGSISTSQENVNGVWDTNYKAVWHLAQATGTNATDSTSNAATATQTASPTQGSGEIDGSLAFNGSTQYLTFSSSAPNITGDKTVECWVNATSFAENPVSFSPRFIHDNIDGTNGYQMTILSSTSGWVWAVNDSGGQRIVSTNTYSTSTWYHLVGTYVASSHTVALYVNGVSKSDGSASGWGTGTSTANRIGQRNDGNGKFTGSLDEIRISNVARSAGWITTSYNSQSSPSTFYSVGSAQTVSQKDVSARFRLMSANQLKDIVSRFRLRSADQLKDVVIRLRLRSADQPKDIGTRFRLAILKDVATRLRLRSADQLKDIAGRFKLRSADQTKDISARFRLSSTGTQSIKDIASRFLLRSADQLKDISARFRLRSADQAKDTTIRFRLMSADQLRDIATRFRLRSADRLRDVVGRLRLMSASQLKDLASRFRLMSASQLKDVSGRLRLRSADQSRDIVTRLRIMSANQLRDTSTRLRLRSSDRLRDIASRFVLAGVANQRFDDIVCRFILTTPPDVVWTTRDNIATWTTRDNQDVWNTRDDKMTWKTRR